jgi:hypothetical protein
VRADAEALHRAVEARDTRSDMAHMNMCVAPGCRYTKYQQSMCAVCAWETSCGLWLDRVDCNS